MTGGNKAVPDATPTAGAATQPSSSAVPQRDAHEQEAREHDDPIVTTEAETMRKAKDSSEEDQAGHLPPSEAEEDPADHPPHPTETHSSEPPLPHPNIDLPAGWIACVTRDARKIPYW